MNMSRFFWLSAFCCMAWVAPFSVLAAHIAQHDHAPLVIVNATHEDVLSVGFDSAQGPQNVRLDMAPGGSDNMDNPGGTVNMRVDTGLALWKFVTVPLGQSTRITLRQAAKPELDLTMNTGASRRITGEIQNLLPEQEEKPVCALQRFRPGMPMKEVCDLLADAPHDDNGALLTSLGFAGMIWAARLESSLGEEKGMDILDHLQLRRRLDQASFINLLNTLYTQKYALWQAELPGIDINFPQMPVPDPSKQDELLKNLLKHFFVSGKGEASIMLAPANMLPRLADADDPPNADVQLFNIVLRPASHVMIVDVSAYQEGEATSRAASERSQ